MVSIVTSGQPADGYEVGGTRLTRGDTVVIAGSASTIQKIDRITAPINVSGLSSGDTLERPCGFMIRTETRSQIHSCQIWKSRLRTVWYWRAERSASG